MIAWKRENVFNLLCLFGDDKPHSWMEIINLGTRLFVHIPIQNRRYKTHQAKFEDFLRKAVNYGLVDKIEPESISKRRQTLPTTGIFIVGGKEDCNYKLSTKGDRLLRQEQAEREADRAFYYNMFDRSVDGEFGVDRFAPLTPTNLGIKDKQVYKAKDLKREDK